MKVEVYVCFGPDLGIAKTFISSWQRHRPGKDVVLRGLLVQSPEIREVCEYILDSKVLNSFSLIPESGISRRAGSSGVHGSMLDLFLPGEADADIVGTMDSDCLPVADGWLDGLVQALEVGPARLAGILHPWKPPHDKMNRKSIEWRVRSQHCWLTTHVACQFMKKSTLQELCRDGAKYAGGDDTGLLFPYYAKKRGWCCGGYMPTRSPVSRLEDCDPEFNRYIGVVYGDCLVHIGGATRESMGDVPLLDKAFGWVKGRIIEEQGAEFLLSDDYSCRYRFDREDEVVREKMMRMFGMDSQRFAETLKGD